MITMKDIARKVGVSTSTISLVLNNQSQGRVSESTARAIRKLAQEYGYSPNPLAQSLRTKKTRTIGMLSNQVLTLPFPSELISGAQKAAFDNNYIMLFIDTDGQNERQTIAINALLQRSVDGLLIAFPARERVTVPDIPEQLPVVVLNGEPTGDSTDVDSIVPDDQGGAKIATKALIAAGHKRIAYCSVEGYEATALRIKGYRQALEEEGIPYDPSLVVSAHTVDTQSSLPIAKSLLEDSDPPTAVCCFCDQVGMAFYEVAALMGLSVPRDLSIVGFDNQRFVAEALSPGLSTIELPLKEMGIWATERLIADMSDDHSGSGPKVHELMNCPLIRRGSIAPPAEILTIS